MASLVPYSLNTPNTNKAYNPNHLDLRRKKVSMWWFPFDEFPTIVSWPLLVDDPPVFVDSIETMIYLEMTYSVKKGDVVCRKRQQVTNIPKKIPKKIWKISILHGKNEKEITRGYPPHF